MEEKRIAVVTGVSSGIGRATAMRLAGRGYRVFGTAREPGRREPVPGVEIVPLDVRLARSVSACVTRVLAAAGRIDVLVNNAGYLLLGGAEETSAEQARALFETNFFGLMRMTAEVLPGMRARRSGAVVNLSSVAGLVPTPFMGVYAASKHAVEAYSEALHHEVSALGVRVLLVEPSFTRTRLETNGALSDRPLEDYEGPRSRALGVVSSRFAVAPEPEEVARAIVGALEARSPHLRLPVGETARLALLRRLVPAGAFARSVRKRFAIDGPSAPTESPRAGGSGE